MSKKKRAHHPTPAGNRTTVGPEVANPAAEGTATGTPEDAGAAFNEQDPKRRLGGFETAGEHAFKQPGGKNDAQRGSGGM
jgi:hypothetical protein